MSNQKEYSNGELTVVWESSECIHSAICARNLPSVFQPKERPWVKVDAESTTKIKEVIDRCPSSALSYIMNTEEEMSLTNDTVRISIYSEGPLVVDGEICLVHPNGEEEIKKKAALCRCGHSTNKPFCDGSHKGSGFDQA